MSSLCLSTFKVERMSVLDRKNSRGRGLGQVQIQNIPRTRSSQFETYLEDGRNRPRARSSTVESALLNAVEAHC